MQHLLNLVDFFDTSSIAAYLKKIIPVGLRHALRQKHRQLVFHNAMTKFMRDPAFFIRQDRSIFNQLVYGWSNQGWSAFPEYLIACLEQALVGKGAILECGSGLTTILLGVVAEKTGVSVWTLEHNPQWGAKVQDTLRKYSIGSVHASIRPLKSYGDFNWYEPPLTDMPMFSLVVCDGPPADTKGGRIGMLPVMRSKLSAQAVIMLDDAVREHERSIAQGWAAELRTNVDLLGDATPYIRILLP